MMLTTFRAMIIVALTAGFASAAEPQPQEIVMEEVRVEASFSSGLQLRPDGAVAEMIRRLDLRDAATREAELRKANESPLTKLLDLTKYIPIPLGSSEDRVDIFFRQNYMRADLNPRREDPLALSR